MPTDNPSNPYQNPYDVGPDFPDVPEGDYTDAGVPTFDYVRDRIEQRAGTAIGATELAESTPEAAALDEKLEETKQAGRERLEEIRRSMREQ